MSSYAFLVFNVMRSKIKIIAIYYEVLKNLGCDREVIYMGY